MGRKALCGLTDIVLGNDMATFIKVTEIWVPGKDPSVLELSSGLYGELDSFREATEQQQFHYGEGLPGSAWKEARPIILKDFDDPLFKRGKLASEQGLTAAVALPIFIGEVLIAVVMFLCGDDEEHAGAIEVWRYSERHDVMKHDDGYYGTMERFEWISRRLQFVYGRGLPGGIWESRQPMVIDDLSTSTTFLRARNAAEAGITTALGVPCIYMEQPLSVMAFLSARGTPLARRFEVWLPDPETDSLRFIDGHCDAGVDLKTFYSDISYARGEGLLGDVWLTGVPRIIESLAEDASTELDSARTAGLGSLFVMPVTDGSRITSLVVFGY